MRKDAKKYGDLMGAVKKNALEDPDDKYMVSNIKSNIVITLRDPQYIKEFLQKQSLYTKTKLFDMIKMVAGTGLVAAEGDTWKRHRKIVSNSFHYEFLKEKAPMIQETAQEFFGKVKPEEMKDYKVISKIQEITGEIVGKIFFGKHLNSYSFEGKPLTLALAEIMNEVSMIAKSPLTLLLGMNVFKVPGLEKPQKFMKKVKAFRKICYDMIQDRKSQKSSQDHNDLLASLLRTQNSEDLESRYSDEDIVNEFITFFVAGMDTTGHVIGMALYNLTQHSDKYWEELKEEREKIYNSQGKISADALQKMDVLHCFLKETLRFHSPAPSSFIRNSTEDHVLHDLKVKKGEHLRADFFFLFHNPKYFKDPHVFNIDRWRGKDLKMDPYAFTPFSAGPRNCIGQHLSIMEAKIIISEFLNKFEFKLKEGYVLKMTARFLYEPEDELIFELVKRK